MDNIDDIISLQSPYKRNSLMQKIHYTIDRKLSTLSSFEENVQDYVRLLKGNKTYVEEKLKSDPYYFLNKSKLHKPKYMLIGCCDARVPPNEITMTDPGEIFIHRNVANQVLCSDLNCMSTIQYAIEHLNVEHIIVMGHTKCGGIRAAINCEPLGLIDQWLQHIRETAVKYRSELDYITDELEFENKLIELNVREQALNIYKISFVQKAIKDGRKVQVHGWICDIETGMIKELTLSNSDWEDIESYFKYDF